VLVRDGQALLELDPRQERTAVLEHERQLNAGNAVERSERITLQERIASLRGRLDLVLRLLQALAREGDPPRMAESEHSLAGLGFQSEESRGRLRRELEASRTRLERITLRAPVAGHVLDLKL
jgi:multidrug resistance efflux pump